MIMELATLAIAGSFIKNKNQNNPLSGTVVKKVSENEIKQFSNVLGIGTEILTEHIKTSKA